MKTLASAGEEAGREASILAADFFTLTRSDEVATRLDKARGA